MNYMVAVAVGPVQDFIAAARRCRDLWFGSYLLSELSKAAAKCLSDHGAELIFPAPSRAADLQPGTPFTVANKLLATAETSDVGELLKATQRAVQDRLSSESDLRRMRLRGTVIEEDRYRSQLEELVEFYGAWTPSNGRSYKETRRRVEELLAARKALRTFPAYEHGEGRYKSSLDGAREDVILKRSERLYESNLKNNEYLDAIGVVKRFGGGNPRFDSTVDVAALPFVEGVRNHPKKAAAFQRYREFVDANGLPRGTYSLLYEHESRQLFQDNEVLTEELAEIRAVLGKPNPPYYALLVGDGDRMGEAISKLEDKEGHQKFSRDLSGFASEARRLIEQESFGGCAIYCGGDDVLALLPLHTALDCAKAVRDLFQKSMKPYGVTFSAGLVVAHGLEPLTEVREMGRRAEAIAKSPAKGNRDALCISVQARSGAPFEVHGKWDEVWTLMTRITKVHGEIPQGFAYEVRDLVERLEGWTEIDSSLRDLVLAIAGKKECSAEAKELIREEAQGRDRIRRFYTLLMAAKWFTRAQREASNHGTNHRN